MAKSYYLGRDLFRMKTPVARWRVADRSYLQDLDDLDIQGNADLDYLNPEQPGLKMNFGV